MHVASRPNFWHMSRQQFSLEFQRPWHLQWFRDRYRSLHPGAAQQFRASAQLFHHFDWQLPRVSERLKSQDGTIKLLVELHDGALIETVLLPFHRKYSVCLSSQVGCKVKCTFCRTGSMNNFRQLSSAEIVGQYLLAREELRMFHPKAPNPNIVFMGQGEPLQNFHQVQSAIATLLDPWAVELGPRQITLSTAGHLPGLQRWQELGGINLAISLHTAIQEERQEIIPIARQYPLTELKAALQKLQLRKRQFITFEYLLLQDFNHSPLHAQALVDFCQDLPAIINLIPFNPYPGARYRRPSSSQVEEFKQLLVASKLPTMVRTTKGDEVLAACGQLASDKFIEKVLPIQ